MTNPDSATFRLHLKELGVAEVTPQTNVGKKIMKLFSGVKSSIQSVSTDRKDYYFFSIHSLEWNGERTEYLGIADHFIELSSQPM